MAELLAWLLGRREIDKNSDEVADQLACKALACAETAAAVRLEIDLLMSAPVAFY